jgi:predicted enzyme related to lactoylglutathione lyase
MGFAPPAADAPEVVVYFRVDDVDAYAARVVELGGRVLATDDYASGRGAECVDDQGHRFDLWSPAPGY